MKIGIIEDEIPARKHLISLISEITEDAEVIFEAQSVKEVIDKLTRVDQPDLIFMDIQLNDGSSFDIFKKIDVTAPVIFTTAYDQYMQEAFHENGIEYLLKPIKKSDLERALKKFAELDAHFSRSYHDATLPSRDPGTYKKRFLVKKGIHFKSILLEEIAYFFSEHKVTFLVGESDEKYIVEQTLTELEQELNPADFFRVNRKYIASHQAIDSFRPFGNGKLLLHLSPETKDEVIVSQEKAAIFKRWMAAE